MDDTQAQNVNATDILDRIPRIARERLSHQIVTNQVLQHRNFFDFDGLKSKFVDYDFSYSNFYRAYFRDARFENCTFTGCRFHEVNFKNASFYNCNLKFAKFYRCELEAERIVVALPFEPNIRRESLHNLMANVRDIGDYASLRLLVLQEIAATKDHYWRALRGADSYYQQKYGSAISKLSAGWTLVRLYVSGFIWGNGERPGNILTSGLTILLALTLIDFWSVMPRIGWSQSVGGLRVLQYTTSLFLGIPVDHDFKGFLIVDYVIAAMRYVYVGLYVAVLYKKIARR